MSDDDQTYGGRYRRSSQRPTPREMMLLSSPPPEIITIEPPTRERALELAKLFLSGPEGQRQVGRDGCELMARRLQADAEERETLWQEYQARDQEYQAMDDDSE